MLLLAFLAACDDASAPPPPSRTVGSGAAVKKEAKVEDFCEVHPPADQAKTFTLPELDGPPTAAEAGWKWVNVWATWCGPCVEEMPMLVKWQERMSKEGAPFTLRFLSVDAEADVLAQYMRAHPGTPPTMRLAKQDQLGAWLTANGLDATAVLPIHMLVDPQDRVRCVRMGGLQEKEYEVAKKVIAGG